MRPARVVWIVLALVAMALAGCSDSGAGSGASDVEAPMEAQAPVWELADWWRFSRPDGGEATLVVTEEQGADWIIDTDDAGVALYHAQEQAFNQSGISFLGAVRKSDLAGSQGSDRPQFFQWPLTDGATWTTTWDRQQRTLTAHAIDGGRWHIIGTAGGATVVEYTYDPVVRWFRDLTFHDQAGQGPYVMELTDHGRGFSGELVRYSVQANVLEESWTAPAVASYNFEIPAGVNELGVTLHVACPDAAQGQAELQAGEGNETPGQAVVLLTDPRIAVVARCPGEGMSAGSFAVEGDPWLVRSIAAADQAELALAVEFRTRTTLSV